jgi:copper chaperone CopZ
MTDTNYTVTGITCGHCVAAIKEEVGAIPGVTGVDLDTTGAMTVHSEAAVDFDRIVEALYEAGDQYSVA